MSPSQLSSFNSTNSLSVAKALNSNGQKLSSQMAMSLGKNIPANQPIDEIASIASAVPLSCFNNTNPNTLCNLISSMDIDNMSPFKKAFIVSKVFIKNDYY